MCPRWVESQAWQHFASLAEQEMEMSHRHLHHHRNLFLKKPEQSKT